MVKGHAIVMTLAGGEPEDKDMLMLEYFTGPVELREVSYPYVDTHTSSHAVWSLLSCV